MTDLLSSPLLPSEPIHAVLVDEVRLLRDFHTRNIRLVSLLKTHGVFVPVFLDNNSTDSTRYLVICRRQNISKPKSWRSAHRALHWLAEHLSLSSFSISLKGTLLYETLP
ncbi:hypothetical protein [Entomobacter blattae]|uniref:Uncharacterized protein n=1 Tax=Entomobacter blattae TaxID=2762277 RepID=A0A7H1NRQ9_9PROT|nr:hypothetical protein [Entomobacter blattae]QNT77555.1 hypothetical protein JGUZn3_02980 [Entomobacter blattae]QNT78469.1 hypothetical protein JGUZn3_12430 [Entomobacter blattae]